MDETKLKQLQTEIITNKTKLETIYQQSLRETLFTNRSQIRPTQVKRVATEEIESLLDFLQDGQQDKATKRGEDLYQFGLGNESILHLGQATRQFFLTGLSQDLREPTMKVVENYHRYMMLGFLKADKKIILEEQERIRSAMERTLSYRNKQMELAAGMGQVCQATLDLDNLLEMAIEFIQMSLNFYFVGIFLIDEQTNSLVLRAATGEVGQKLLSEGFKLEIKDESTIGWCMLRGKHRILRNAVTEIDLPVETPLQIVLPLMLQQNTLGAITLYHQQDQAFSEEDLSALSIVADQLANAIENASLYAVSQSRLQQSETEQERLQQEVIETQQKLIQELSTPIIPLLDGIIIMPLVGAVDSGRAQDFTRTLLKGIREYRAKVVILDITGIPVVDTGVAAYLDKAIQAARLKGARTIVTGISDAVAESVVDLGIDWSGIRTLRNLQAGLIAALDDIGMTICLRP